MKMLKRITCRHRRKVEIACCHEIDDFEPWVWGGGFTEFCPDCLWAGSFSVRSGAVGLFVALADMGPGDILSPWVPASMREMLLVYLHNPRTILGQGKRFKPGEGE